MDTQDATLNTTNTGAITKRLDPATASAMGRVKSEAKTEACRANAKQPRPSARPDRAAQEPGKAFEILNSPIPDGMGRKLTSAEAKSLRKFGVRCSEGWIVKRLADSGGDGCLWYRYSDGYNSTRIRVRTK